MKKPDDNDGSSRAILLLYGLFAAIWCLGLILGLKEGVGQSMFGGLPLWFTISCVLAYAVVAVVLALTVRRYFK